MLQILIKVIMTCALASSALAQPQFTKATVVDPLARSDNGAIPALPVHIPSKATYRQASRDSILTREERRAASRGRALQPRQSARVYPTCATGTTESVPQSGFVNFPDYALDSATSINLEGYFATTNPEIACVMLCETTPGCTAGVWYGGNTCILRQGTITGSNFLPRPNTDRVSFIRGDCASLEGQINNSTIMEACCNNPPPSTINRCTFSGYQNLGKYCVQTRNQYTAANRITTLNVAGGDDFYAVMRNCAAYCTSYTANNRNGGSHNGCTVATASYNTNGGPNCAIYGGALNSMSSSDAEFTVAMIAGTCEQVTASTLSQRAARGGCFSNQSGGA